MPLPQEPHYQHSLPDGWQPTAWEPPTAALQATYAALQNDAWPEAQMLIAAALVRDPAASDAYHAQSIMHAIQQQWPEALKAADSAVMLSNQYHHYVHYICSTIHCARAEWATTDATRTEAIEAALFQDHTNARALALRDGALPLPAYDLPMWEDEEWPAAIRPPAGKLSAQDMNSGAWLCRDAAPVRRLAAVAFGHAAANRMDDARTTMEEVARLAHRWHRHYHRQASLHRLQRGRIWQAMEEPYLALDEFRHAHDIDPGYATPLLLRSTLYQQLGKAREAEADQQKATILAQAS
jgi:tetratricopeptide (TPR) repeat protein